MNVFKHSAIVLSLNWLLVPLNFITGALIARAVGPEGKGVLLLLAGVSGVLLSLLSLGLPSAAAYFYKQGRQPLGQIVTVCLLLSLLLTFIAVLLFVFWSDDFIRIFMGNTESIVVQPLWIWLTLAGLLSGLISPLGDVLLIIDGQMKLYTVKSIAGGLLGIALTWLLALALAWGITGVLLSQLLASVLPISVLAYWLLKKGSQSRPRFSLETLKEMLRVGLQQYGVSLVATVAKRFDTFLVAGLLSVRDAGYFSIAYSSFNLLVSVPRATMWPMVSKLAGQDKGDHSEYLTMALRIQFTLMLALAIGMGLFTPWLIHTLYGESFLPATGAVWAILPAIVLASLTIGGNAYFTSIGRPGMLVAPALVSTLAQILTSVVLMPQIGIVGNSIAFAVNQLVVGVWSLYLVAKYTHTPMGHMLFISRADITRIHARGVRPLVERVATRIEVGYGSKEK